MSIVFISLSLPAVLFLWSELANTEITNCKEFFSDWSSDDDDVIPDVNVMTDALSSSHLQHHQIPPGSHRPLPSPLPPLPN